MDSCIHVTTPDGFLRNEDCFKQKYFVCGIDQSEIFIEHPTGDIYLHNITYIQHTYKKNDSTSQVSETYLYNIKMYGVLLSHTFAFQMSFG